MTVLGNSRTQETDGGGLEFKTRPGYSRKPTLSQTQNKISTR